MPTIAAAVTPAANRGVTTCGPSTTGPGDHVHRRNTSLSVTPCHHLMAPKLDTPGSIVVGAQRVEKPRGWQEHGGVSRSRHERQASPLHHSSLSRLNSLVPLGFEALGWLRHVVGADRVVASAHEQWMAAWDETTKLKAGLLRGDLQRQLRSAQVMLASDAIPAACLVIREVRQRAREAA
jgi:hypothetical protein